VDGLLSFTFVSHPSQWSLRHLFLTLLHEKDGNTCACQRLGGLKAPEELPWAWSGRRNIVKGPDESVNCEDRPLISVRIERVGLVLENMPWYLR